MQYVGLKKIGGRVARRNGLFDSPMEAFARELCAESGTAKQYQDDLRKIVFGADEKIKSLSALPESAERDRLIAEFRKNKADSLKIIDYIYEAQQFGVDAGLDECKRFFSGPTRNNVRRNAPVLVPILWGSVAVVGLAAIYKIVQEIRLGFGNNTKAYETLIERQVEYAQDVCERAKTDPSYRSACEKAMAQLAESGENAPPSSSGAGAFIPYIVLGVAALLGYRVLVNRLSARDDYRGF